MTGVQVLFAIIFADTGFVVTPFLPGDSLFACGALGAGAKLPVGIWFTLRSSSLRGYGELRRAFLGQVAIEKPKIFKPEYIAKTRTFTINTAEERRSCAFVIVRTFAPFIAGVAKMNYSSLRCTTS